MTELTFDAETLRRRKIMALWLFAGCVMVFIMVNLGGATRLTGSGLSMVEWKPLHVLPPLNDAQWAAEFAAYQQFPEFQQKNSWMNVDDFKGIFWLEYLHRLWGRLIGFVFFVPFVFFLVRGWMDRPLALKCLGLFALGGAQGVMGWIMVASGLVDRPDVSQYKLAAHLFLAFLVFVLMQWVAMDLWSARVKEIGDDLKRHAQVTLSWVFATFFVVISGAFVAGLDAGFTWNTWPLMDGAIVPDRIYETGLIAAFEHQKTVQFNHRMLAMTLALGLILFWVLTLRSELPQAVKARSKWVALGVTGQATLGVSTLLMAVPLSLGVAHQAGALVLLAILVWHLHGCYSAQAVSQTAPRPAAPAAAVAAE